VVRAADEVRERVPDAKKCVIVVEELKDVGFRIADAQAVAQILEAKLRERVGRDGVIYGGVAKSQAQLQKMLGPGVETPAIQQEKLDYFKAAEANAKWRVSAKFGTNKKAPADKRNWITVACRKADSKTVVDEKRVEAKTFADATDALRTAMPTFCLAIPAPEQLPIEGVAQPNGPDAGPGEPPGMRKKKEPKAWTPPPPR
jgi:hypothetical protein